MTHNTLKYCLQSGSGASPVLKKISHSEHSGATTELLLASGFSAVSPEQSQMLSAALQLNGDLAIFNDSQLREFAEAEFRRKNQSVFSSYTQEADNRVCVLGRNAEQLDTFLDIYGGILQADPLLLESSSPHYENVTELLVRNDQENCIIEYSVRSPVDIKKCNYCGECGTTCPVACISETLHFDYTKCTLCKDCEKACKENAIDIHAIEKRELTVPAIIVLEGSKVDLPDHSPRIFHQTEITDYLSTLFPCQVEEILVCTNEICQNRGNDKAGCTKCIEVCPSNSIHVVSGKITIDAISCIECGNCAGICPTGAIQYQRYPDELFIEFFRDYSLPQNSTVVIGTETDLHRFWWNNSKTTLGNHVFLEYPHLSGLSFCHLIFLLAHGASQVILLVDKNKSPVLLQTVKDTNRLISLFFETSDRILLSSTDKYLKSKPIKDLSSLTSKTYGNLNYINRRQKLSSVLNFFNQQTGNTITLKKNEIADFATVLCDQNKCTQCLACLNECNTQSLTADPAALKLSWQGSFCIGCGACITTCPEKALSFDKKVKIDTDYFLPATLAQAEPMRCKECGKTYGTKKSFEHVMKILSARDMDKDGFFEYCEDCRVMKLLESE